MSREMSERERERSGKERGRKEERAIMGILQVIGPNKANLACHVSDLTSQFNGGVT